MSSTLQDKLAAFLKLGVAPEAEALMIGIVDALSVPVATVESLQPLHTGLEALGQTVAAVQETAVNAGSAAEALHARVSAIEQHPLVGSPPPVQVGDTV